MEKTNIKTQFGIKSFIEYEQWLKQQPVLQYKVNFGERQQPNISLGATKQNQETPKILVNHQKRDHLILLSHIKLPESSNNNSAATEDKVIGVLVLMQRLSQKVHLLPVFLQKDRRLAVVQSDCYFMASGTASTSLQEMVMTADLPIKILRLVLFDDQLRATAQSVHYPFAVVSSDSDIALYDC